MNKFGVELRKILKKYGKETFLDRDKMQLLLSIYVPEMINEKELFSKIYQANLQQSLFEMANLGLEPRLAILKAAIESLNQNFGIKTEKAEQLMQEICRALDCRYVNQRTIDSELADDKARQTRAPEKNVTKIFAFLMFVLIIGMVLFSVTDFPNFIRSITSKVNSNQQISETSNSNQNATDVNQSSEPSMLSEEQKEALAKSVNLYRIGAAQGGSLSQNNLATCYLYGLGIAQDEEQAVYWYQKAADQGLAVAQCNLGDCYFMGNGVAQDFEQAFYWFQLSAEQDFAVAQTSLGYCYQTGRGVAVDIEKAKYWYQKAAEQGDANAIILLQELE
ncbi:MAG: hypothetical protein CSA05_03390 [Bacteroidia bacterium]|nr:MAG: hypothetical protein CSA05_03390 [Bacteroidia bacterium]